WLRGDQQAIQGNGSKPGASAPPGNDRPTSQPEVKDEKLDGKPALTVIAGQPVLLQTLKAHTGEVTWVAFAPDGKSFASASFDKTVRLWKLNEEEPFAKLVHKERVTCVAFAPGGKSIATCTETDGAVRLWDIDSAKETLLGVHGPGGRSL